VPYRVPVHNQSATELKRQLEIEREGRPFLVYRDPGGTQRVVELGDATRLVIGRGEDVDLRIDGDELVSRLHAELSAVGGSWVVADDGLSSNGTFIGDERLGSRRRLRDRDLIVVGGTGLLFRDPGAATAPAPTRAASGTTPPELGDVQRRVLVELCRPLLGDEAPAAAPASNAEIATALHMSVGAVKANLRVLFEKFGVGELPQNQKRTALAAQALHRGSVEPRDA
jgi:predicted component of type VI protein secretion system